jgi:Ca2+-binding EF-hand superfamily protein
MTRANEEVDAIFKKVDLNNNGSVDFSEFLAVHLTANEINSQSNLKAAFQAFDIVFG